MKYFNEGAIDSIKNSIKMSPRGFKYGFVQGIFREDIYPELLKCFPPLERFKPEEDEYIKTNGGVFYDSVQHDGCMDHLSFLDPRWMEIMEEATSAPFIQRLSSATGVTFNSLRGFGFNIGTKGSGFKKPHLDHSATSKHPKRTKLVCMLYLAPKKGSGPGGTRIYDIDKTTVLFEAPDLYNSLLFFEQHHEAWHGYPMLTEDIQRKTLQLTFNNIDKPVMRKKSLLHRMTCMHALKSLFSK